jgi:acetylornithine deacetylase
MTFFQGRGSDPAIERVDAGFVNSIPSVSVTVTIPDRDLLAKLVSFPSISGGNDAELVDFVCDYLDRPGLSVERVPSSDGTRCNLLISAGSLRDDRNGLALCGHLDVVPADEPGWTSDPFTLVDRDGKLFARGACDMKASVAIAMNILVNASTRSLKHPLVGVFTFDEELGSLGAQQLVMATRSRLPLPLDCIIGEPTSLKPVRMHKGHLKLRITITGKAAHSGAPHLGINAIEPAGEIITQLTALRHEHAQFRNEQSERFREVPFPVLCVARIRGGEAINVIPERCEIDVGVRLMPGMQSADAIAEVQDIVSAVRGSAHVDLSIVNDNPPMLCERTPLVETLSAVANCTEDVGVSFASDAGVLQRDLGMRCVLFGPGTIDIAHRPDEFVPIAEFEQCSAIVAKLAHRWCEA